MKTSTSGPFETYVGRYCPTARTDGYVLLRYAPRDPVLVNADTTQEECPPSLPLASGGSNEERRSISTLQ